MANRIKKDRSADTNSINPGNWTVNLEGTGTGPTSTTGFNNGIQIPAGGYAIYTDGINARTAANDNELIFIINKLGANVSTVSDALSWAKTADVLVLNNSFDHTVTDGLVTYLDAKHKTSYPGGAVWYSVHGHTPVNELKVLAFRQHATACPFYNWFNTNTILTETLDIMSLSVATIKSQYDVVVIDAYVWSFGSTVMQRLKDLVDEGVSCIGTGNDNRGNVFVSGYNSSGRQSHDIVVENDSRIGYGGQTFTYGSGDVYGGISSLANGAVPVYRRADSGLITGFIYDNPTTGASLYFDQEGIAAGTELVQAGIDYVLKNEGNKATFVNTPVFDASTNSFYFNETNEYFNLSDTAVEDLAGDVTLTGFCKQASTGAPHQTVIGTATAYRAGVKLMSRYHGPASVWIGNPDETQSYVLSSGVDITNDGQWHHLATTRNSTTGELKIYIDGVLKNTATTFTGELSMSGPATVGVDYHSAGYNHTGNIAAAKAYNRVLSADEIMKEYYGSNLVTTVNPRLVVDPANIKSFTTGDSTLTDLAYGTDFTIEGTGSKIEDNNGVLRLNAGRIYAPTTGWYGKMATSWWMRWNGPKASTKFYTESFRGSGGCSRIASNINSDGTFGFSVWDNSSHAAGIGGGRIAYSTTDICDGNWHHVTVQWSNGSGNIDKGMYVFVNGILEGHDTLAIGNDGGYQHMHLGGSFGCVGDYSTTVDFGPIVQYKNYNLSYDEVYQNYSAHAARFK